MRMLGMSGTMLQYLKAGQTENRGMLIRSMSARRGAYYISERENKGDNVNEGTSGNTNNSVYEATKTATSGLRDHAKKLLDTGKNSLFEKAKESKDTKEVVLEVNRFISDYNSMITTMKKAGGSVNESYSNQLGKNVEKSKEALTALGITTEKDGTLVVDEKILKGASIEELQKVFSGANSFVNTVSIKSIYVEANAISIKSSFQSKEYYNGYNLSGNYRTSNTNESFQRGV